MKLPGQTIHYWGKSFTITRHFDPGAVCSVFHQKPHQSCSTETWAIKADGPHVDARQHQHQPGVKLKTSQWQVGHFGLIAFGALECYQPLDCRQAKICSNS